MLRGAGYAAAAGVSIGAAPAGLRTVRRRPSVAVFGGGIAGLTAAHELLLRGFDVTVFERRAWGGKARSMGAAGTGTGGRAPLPGEHGHRVEFGFYTNLPETLREIPFGSNPNGVFDNLVGATEFAWARDGGRRDLVLPVDPRRPTGSPGQALDLVRGLLVEADLAPTAVAHFASRLAVFLSSCDARRTGQWEEVSWADFIQGERHTEDQRKLLEVTFSQLVVASKSDVTSANFSGRLIELAVHNLLGRGANGPLFRVTNRPTSDAWIDPWVRHLEHLGVDMRVRESLAGWRIDRGLVSAAIVDGPAGRQVVAADWYVCALPAERASALWNPDMLAVDPALRRMQSLPLGWMNGIQFYLREPRPIIHGFVDFLDSPWLLSSYSQGQFWLNDLPRDHGDGTVQESISVIASDWNRPGVLFDRPARMCTPEQVAAEVWEQMKRHLNDTGEERLTDDLLHSWHLDPGLSWHAGQMHNEDPLILPAVGSRANRPDVATAIPNLFLCGDYVLGDMQVANMDAANLSGRDAVNALLERAGSQESPVATSSGYHPPEWEAAKRLDEERWRRGEPNLFDTANPPDDNVLEHLGLTRLRSPIPRS